MPLTAKAGEPQQIRQINGNGKTRIFLEALGFVAGGFVTVVTELGGSMIVTVKDTRVAISKSMATRIMIAQK